MKDMFSFVLAVTLACLYILNGVRNVSAAFLVILSLACFLSSIAAYIFKKYTAGYILVSAAIGLIIGGGFVRDRIEYDHTVPKDVPTGEYITVTGYLTDFPEIRPEHSILTVQTDTLAFEKKTINRRFNVRIKVTGDLRHLCRSDYIAIEAQLFHHRFHSNFYHNRREDQVRIKKIHMSGSCKSRRLVTRLARGSILWRGIGGWRNAIRKRIESKFLDRDGVMREEGVFLEAILIGDRGRLSPASGEKLLHTGIFHLFAISGAHIGMIAVFSLLVMKWLPVSPRRRSGITMAVLVIFLFLSGFKISAVRAVMMAVLILAARLWWVGTNIFNIISLTALTFLSVNPTQCLSPGFVLTFALTAAIVRGRRIFVPIFSGFPKSLSEFLSANLSASLAALPLSLLFFKRYACLAFLSGLMLIPVATAVMMLGMFLMLAAPVSVSLSAGLLHLLSGVSSLFFGVTAFLSGTVAVTIFRASPPLWLILIFGALFWLLGAGKLKSQKKTVILLLFILAGLAMTIRLSHYRPGHMEVYFLDVGQGDSSVVVFPGGKALLIDGGGSRSGDFEVGKQVVLPFLLQKRIRVEWAAVSHYHPDHCRGLVEILPIIKPREIWISSVATGDALFNRIVNTGGDGTRVRKVVSPFKKAVDDCLIELVFPEVFISGSRSSNNHSQVIRISDASHSFIFTGDIERRVEKILGESPARRLKGDVLKVPHHGSRSSSSESFLNRVSPMYAVFSYARGNSFGFPHPDVWQRYEKFRILTFSTAVDGGIHMMSLKKKLKIIVSRKSSG